MELKFLINNYKDYVKPINDIYQFSINYENKRYVKLEDFALITFGTAYSWSMCNYIKRIPNKAYDVINEFKECRICYSSECRKKDICINCYNPTCYDCFRKIPNRKCSFCRKNSNINYFMNMIIGEDNAIFFIYENTYKIEKESVINELEKIFWINNLITTKDSNYTN